MWEVITREELYPHLKFATQIGLQVSREGLRPPVPADCPEAWVHLMTNCWAHDPQFRPTFQQIINYIDNHF